LIFLNSTSLPVDDWESCSDGKDDGFVFQLKVAYPTDPYYFSELEVDQFLYSQPDDDFGWIRMMKVTHVFLKMSLFEVEKHGYLDTLIPGYLVTHRLLV